MNDAKYLIKIISMIIIIALSFPIHVRADVLNTKNVGKLTMVVILSVTAFLVKKLVNRDIDKTIKVREELGKPDRHIEFHEGFDYWRVEWYGDDVYVFRNDIFSHRMNLTTD